jgi:trehalose 6-phosphate phosphatase
MKDDQQNKRPEDLPNALAQIDHILKAVSGREMCLFLDYDGTLTPIVANPDEAILSHKAREVIKELSGQITVAIISGRDREDVSAKAGINNIIYAGSHGFDISGPNGLDMEHESGEKIIPVLDSAEKHLKEKLRPISGVQIERKKYALAVHFRNAKDNVLPEIKWTVSEVLNSHNELKKGSGKKIIELKPEIDWHKGRALIWLMEKLQLKRDKYIPVFIGDDVTDEDALRVVREDGIGIITGSHNQTTAASYRLDDPDQVIAFLEKLKNLLDRRTHT